MKSENTKNESDDQILYSVCNSIATITLNRPERRNALSLAANIRLHGLWEKIDSDPNIRAVILTSADCGTFCAGMDLKEAAELRQSTGKDILDLLADPFYERMRKVTVPIIASMTGHFTAAGMVLAANSDMRVGLSGTKGGITEARIGRGTPWAAPMIAMLPQAILMELVTTGEMMPIERFLSLGFINFIEPTPEAVRVKAMSLALDSTKCAPICSSRKAGLLASCEFGANAGYEISKALHRQVYASHDAIEGPSAFAEKREPVWTCS